MHSHRPIALLGLVAACLAAGVGLAQSTTAKCFWDESGTDCTVFLKRQGNPYAGLSAPPLFSFASPTAFYDSATRTYYPENAGLPVASDLCDTLTSDEKVGNWFCLKGDGTMASGSQQTLTAKGTPAASFATRTVCPNGPSCGSVSVTRFSTNGGATTGQAQFESATVAPPSGAFTLCQLIDYGASDSYQTLVSFADTGSTIGVLWQSSPVSNAVAMYYGGSNRRTVTMPGGRTLLCSTANADQSSGQAYLNGAAEGATYTSTLGAYGSQTWSVSAYGTGAYPIAGTSQLEGTFMVETELSGARIAAIARAVLADTPTGTKGEALTFTRATASSCPLDANESELTLLPAGRPCVTRGGLRVNRAYTNYALRSDAFQAGIGAWTNANAGGGSATTVTADQALGPHGAAGADRLQTSACSSAGAYSIIYQSFGPGSAAPCNFSVWVKGNGTSGSISIGVHQAGGGTLSQCAYNATTWTRCTHSFATCSVNASSISIGCNNDTANFTGTASTGAADVFIWGAQLTNQGQYAHPYVRTEGSAVAVNTESASFAVTYGTAIETAGSASATVRIPYTPASGINGWVLGHRGNSRFIYFQGTSFLSYDGTANPSASNTMSSTPVSVYNKWLAGASASSLNGVTAWTMSADGFDDVDTTALRVGEQSSIVTGALDGIVGNVCVDSDPTRCR